MKQVSDYRAPVDPKTDPIGTAIQHSRTRLLVGAGSFNVRAEAAAAYRAGKESTLGTPTPLTGLGAVSAYGPGRPVGAQDIRATIEALKIQEKELETEIYDKRRHSERMLDILKTLETVSTPPFLLSKPDGSQAHSWLEAEINDDLVYLDKNLKPLSLGGSLHHESVEIIRNAQIFIVEHDWAAAFKNADVDNGEIRLPYEMSVFEFVINGVRLIYSVRSDINHPSLNIPMTIVFLKCKSGWAALPEMPRAEPFYLMMQNQVKFICIALDAEVAKTDIVRAPHKLNSVRLKRGAPPLYDYHVVSLVKRSRPEALAPSSEPGARKRLHWRRGHWRHFANHKTWIRWQLVGSPDLGFIDKHYKL